MLDLLLQVSGELAARGIPHAMIGAGALAVHGIARSTFDIDLFTTDRAPLSRATWAMLEGRGVVVDVERGLSNLPADAIELWRRISAQRP